MREANVAFGSPSSAPTAGAPGSSAYSRTKTPAPPASSSVAALAVPWGSLFKTDCRLPARACGGILNYMFERFTERARLVVVLAQEEARALKHGHIGTEHILLGLLRQPEEIAAQALASFDITLDRARREVVRIIGTGEEPVVGEMPFTPRAKKALELALQESRRLGHNLIGTEHILLGVLSAADGPTAQIFREFEVTPEAIRAKTIELIGPTAPSAVRPASRPIASLPPVDEWFRVGPSANARRVLMLAAARALNEGRSEIEPRDILLALTRDDQMRPVLADLGADEATVLKAIERRRPPEAPPRASAEG
ncbi:MAG: hypothetical protein JO286_05075 [Solirubrobacterales bacterium]|nr:hypothetical protein [Solirubrobacterales bacterium]